MFISIKVCVQNCRNADLRGQTQQKITITMMMRKTITQAITIPAIAPTTTIYKQYIDQMSGKWKKLTQTMWRFRRITT